MAYYNPNIHHRRSIRLKGYNYSQAGIYFITLCTQDRLHLFGEIIEGKMELNKTGEKAAFYWREIPNHFPNAILHEFIIMPNHIHGIIELDSPLSERAENIPPQSERENIPPQSERNLQFSKFKRDLSQSEKLIATQKKSIGSIIKGYKIGVTKYLRQTDPLNFPKERRIWQRNYYENIIRNQRAYQNISNYIINNPKKWEEDKFKN